MNTKIHVFDLREEQWFAKHLSASSPQSWERALDAVLPGRRGTDCVSSTELAECIYFAAVMPQDIAPTRFLSYCRQEGVPYCEELEVNAIQHLESLLIQPGHAARLLRFDLSLDYAEVHYLAENPRLRVHCFSYEDSTPNPQRAFTVTRLPQPVIQQLVDYAQYGFPIHTK